LIPKDLSVDNISKIYKKIRPFINQTPFLKCPDDIDNYFSTNLFFKCEFLQKSGSFKARGAINNIISQDQNKFNKGITAVSAGNHAIAASFVANQFKLKNKIFYTKVQINIEFKLVKIMVLTLSLQIQNKLFLMLKMLKMKVTILFTLLTAH